MKNAMQTTNQNGKIVIVKPYRKPMAKSASSSKTAKAVVPVAEIPSPVQDTPAITKSYVPRKSRKIGRGRTGLTGMALVIPGLRTIIENKEISPYYRKKLAERGFIGLRLEKEPGTMGRPKIVAVLTSKGLKYWEQHAGKVPGYLLANAA